MKDNTATIITSIIGAIATISAAFIGNSYGEKNAVQQMYSQITTVNGIGNSVTINSVDDFVDEYIRLLNENETLKAQNEQYFEDYTEQRNINKGFESQLSDSPIIAYKNIGLSIDGKDIPVNKNESMISIDGRDYISKEIVEKLIPDDQNFAVKDNILFVGKIIAEKASLLDEVIVDSENFSETNSAIDSYGNEHTNVLYPRNYHSYIRFNVNRQFSYIKFRLAVEEDGYSDAIVTIKADDTVVYTSPKLSITTEPFEVIDIPINQCSLLTIKVDSGPDSGFGKGFDCIISDPIVYN